MNFFSLNYRDQLSLRNAALYIENQNNLENLNFFVNSVELKDSIRDYDSKGFEVARDAFLKGATIYGVKIILPLKTLLLRVLNESIGFIFLHTDFLNLCLKYSVPQEALPILQFPALFKNMTKTMVAQFLCAGCDILIKLKKYRQAYELIYRGSSLEFVESIAVSKLLKRLVVLKISLGYPVTEEDRQKIRQILAMDERLISVAQKKQSQTDRFNRMNSLEFIRSLKSYRQLLPPEQNILKAEGLLDAFKDGKWAAFGCYLKDEIKQNNWRIKAQTIKEYSLFDLEVIKGVNSQEEIYRYDCKNKIMYFNHKESDQEKLNSLITKALSMSQEVYSTKIEKREPVGMGAFRMGGMGGFGSMGLGGMEMFGGRRRHF